jgi:myo-inositol-1(or 4)-monophosphatase
VLAPYCHAVCNLVSLFLFNLSINTMHPMLNVAVKAARRAGTVINRASLNLERLQVDRKQHNDFVTEVDRQAEAAITQLTAF